MDPAPRPDPGTVTIEVRVELKDGIADAEAENIQKSLTLLGIPEVLHVSTARLYVLQFSGSDSGRAEELARRAVDRLLANPVIHRVSMTTLSR
ncbi:MAG: phosphoribosylformylglycinamidine synthase subunit PurS [Thermoplasmata archaeon]